MYGGNADEDDDYDQEDDQQQPANKNAAPAGGDGGGDDLINYKGIYYNDDAGQKYTDPETGAHFEYKDMCKRLQRIQQKREAYEQQLAPPAGDKLSTLQKEKEEFLKSLGLQQNNNMQSSATKKRQQQPVVVAQDNGPFGERQSQPQQ